MIRQNQFDRLIHEIARIEVAGLDDLRACAMRGDLVQELALLCQADPTGAREHLKDLKQILERTQLMRAGAVIRRGELARTLSSFETHLKHLKSFQSHADDDATLIDRLV